MITKIIKVKGGEFAVGADGRMRPVETHYGLSTDPKPTVGVSNADRYLEMDTGEVSLFDETNQCWWPV